jgi:hypothetical protein
VKKWNPAEVWAAGKAALQAKTDAAAKTKAQPAPVSKAVTVAVNDVFNPKEFPFEDRVYRVTFKNGHSGQYTGLVLKRHFPFDPKQIKRVEPVEEVGQGA